MNSQEKFMIPLNSYEDVVVARQKARKVMEEMGYSLIDQTKIITAVSELARNIIVHAGKGTMSVLIETKLDKKGITCVFADDGPGIPDLHKAMQEGFSTVKSLGLGLSGSKNLSDDFSIKSSPGKGSTVTITKWLCKK